VNLGSKKIWNKSGARLQDATNFFNMANPSQKIALKNFDQNENLCETSKKNLRTNFDVS
jgi:hypothetical protein